MKYILFFLVCLCNQAAYAIAILSILNVPPKPESNECLNTLTSTALTQTPQKLQSLLNKNNIQPPQLNWIESISNDPTKKSKPAVSWTAERFDGGSPDRGFPALKTRLMVTISILYGHENDPRTTMKFSAKRLLSHTINMDDLHAVLKDGFVPIMDERLNRYPFTDKEIEELMLNSLQTIKEAETRRYQTLNQELREYFVTHYRQIIDGLTGESDLVSVETFDSILKTEVVRSGSDSVVLNATVTVRGISPPMIELFSKIEKELNF